MHYTGWHMVFFVVRNVYKTLVRKPEGRPCGCCEGWEVVWKWALQVKGVMKWPQFT